MRQTTVKQTVFSKRTLICICTGFSSGLPYYILVTLVPAWLRREGVGLAEIGLFTLIQLPFTSHTLEEAIIKPFTEFFTRKGVRNALLILSFIFLYKLGDNLATALATPFYIDMGFSNTEIGLVAKTATRITQNNSRT
ncbi:MAG: hypothetical protein P8Y45_02250 [Exilibacterium sp.]